MRVLWGALLLGLTGGLLPAPGLAATGADWQGEWGAWTPAAAGAIRGASVSIGDCDAAATRCNLRFEVETAAGMCTSSAAVELVIASDGSAAAALHGVGDEQKRCRLMVKRGGNAEHPELAAELVGPDCGYFCTAGPLPFGLLPRASASPYPVGDARTCFADRRGARQLWCTTESVQARERELTEVEDALEGLIHKPTEGREARLSATIADCQRTDVASTIVPCLEQHVERELALRKTALATAKEARVHSDAELAAPGDAAAAEKMIASVAGVYKSRFKNGLVDGSSYESENILELVAARPGAVYFRTHLEFYNGHVCDLSGLASWRRAGVFLYEGPTLDEDPPCRLRIAVDERAVRLEDADQTCKVFCGARGSFDGQSFPRSAQREIRYLERLKASREYREALGKVVPPQ